MGQKEVGLGDFIRQVREEILKYQDEEKGKEAVFRVDEVELEAKVTVDAGDIESGVDIKIWKFNVKDSADNYQIVKIKMTPVPMRTDKKPPKDDSTKEDIDTDDDNVEMKLVGVEKTPTVGRGKPYVKPIDIHEKPPLSDDDLELP